MSDYSLLPSVLSADFAHLADAVALVERAGADMLHVDVMDGHFVPNLTIGPSVVRAIAKITALPMDVHLMVSDPEAWVEPFMEAGARALSFHIESTPHAHRVVSQIQSMGGLAGICINPGTPVGAVEALLEFVDYVVVMTVNPGFAGQTFIEAGLEKIRLLREWIDVRGFSTLIEVDGGIKEHNIRRAREAGANWFVVGSGIFGVDDPAAMTRRLKEILAE